jgi:hypothetical protein
MSALKILGLENNDAIDDMLKDFMWNTQGINYQATGSYDSKGAGGNVQCWIRNLERLDNCSGSSEG